MINVIRDTPLDDAVPHVESMDDIAKINAFTPSLVDHAKL